MERNNYYLERVTNTVLDKNDFVLTNDLFTLYQFTRSIIGGLNYYYVSVPQSGSRTHRLSLICAYTHKIKLQTTFDAAVIAGSYLQHDYFDLSDPYIGVQLKISYSFVNRSK
jgi:hypothetical protein